MKLAVFCTVLGLGLFCRVSASTVVWLPSEVDDPIRGGKTCFVYKPAAPIDTKLQTAAKYDQVFWPYTDVQSIWYCKSSGYVSFMHDFYTLSAAEKTHINSYLRSFSQSLPNQSDLPNQSEMLRSLEEIYEIRTLDAAYRTMLSRAFAYWYERLGNNKKARRYRKKALVEIETALLGKLSPYNNLQYLYLAANYAHYFNQTKKSAFYLTRLNQYIGGIAELALSDAELSAQVNYFSQLAGDIPSRQAGSPMDTSLEKHTQ